MKRRMILFLLIMALAVLMLSGCSAKKGEDLTVMPEPSYEVLITEPPAAPPVEVTMPEYEFTYAGELKDVIVVNELEDKSGLEFTVKLSGGEAHIFTLHYNTMDGDLVEVLTDSKGERIPVAFSMAELPENLSDADAGTFYRAQESVNEIVSTIILK